MNDLGVQIGPYLQIISSGAGMHGDLSGNRTTVSAVRADSSTPSNTTVADAPAILQGIKYIQNQLTDLVYSDPPFFPVGHPQRPALIKRIRDLQDSIKTSHLDTNSKQMVASGNTLSPNATDKEVSKALDNLYKISDTLNNDQQLSAPPAQPGSLLNIKV